MSSEAISTLRFICSVRRFAIFAVVVVLPEPCRPTIMIATGAGALRSIGSAHRAERFDQLVMDDLHDHLARRHRLDDFDADRAFLQLVDEAIARLRARHRLQAARGALRAQPHPRRQPTARRAASGGRECQRAFPTACRTSKHFRARGRTALSGVDLRSLGPVGGFQNVISCESARETSGGAGWRQ